MSSRKSEDSCSRALPQPWLLRQLSQRRARAYVQVQYSAAKLQLTLQFQPLSTPDPTKLQKLREVFAQPVLASFVAGGVAGAVSRTVVSPLERLKILFQVQSVGREEYKMSVPKALAKMWREEGWRGFMAGNGTNCIRIVPYSAVQFSAYNVYKRVSHSVFAADCSSFGILSCCTWGLGGSASHAQGHACACADAEMHNNYGTHRWALGSARCSNNPSGGKGTSQFLLLTAPVFRKRTRRSPRGLPTPPLWWPRRHYLRILHIPARYCSHTVIDPIRIILESPKRTREKATGHVDPPRQHV